MARARLGYRLAMQTSTALYEQYQRAHENLDALRRESPSPTDLSERARALREAVQAELRVIRLCRDAMGWLPAA